MQWVEGPYQPYTTASVGRKPNLMNNLSNDKSQVLGIATAVTGYLQTNPEASGRILASLPGSDPEAIKKELLARISNAHEVETRPPYSAYPTYYVPRHPELALIQSAGLEQPGNTDLKATAQYDTRDPRWVECAVDKLLKLFKPKVRFPRNSGLGSCVTSIPSTCRIALIADFGAQNEAARNVAKQVKLFNPNYVIHLGDIYYSGEDSEVDAFLKLMPSGSIKDFVLPGNHELISGGHAFYERLLPQMGQQTSYFALQNEFWQIIGLDTAFGGGRLVNPKAENLDQQWTWLLDKLIHAKGKKSILLTHHQPFSRYQHDHDESRDFRTKDVAALTSLAGPNAIFGWFFGHEHRTIIYDDSTVQARLIGNGAIPHPVSERAELSGLYSKQENLIPRPGDEEHAMCGFALLSFTRQTLLVNYINEDGTVWYHEVWTSHG